MESVIHVVNFYSMKWVRSSVKSSLSIYKLTNFFFFNNQGKHIDKMYSNRASKKNYKMNFIWSGPICPPSGPICSFLKKWWHNEIFWSCISETLQTLCQMVHKFMLAILLYLNKVLLPKIIEYIWTKNKSFLKMVRFARIDPNNFSLHFANFALTTLLLELDHCIFHISF